MLTCKRCLASIPDVDKFCGQCGYVVSDSANIPTANVRDFSNQITIPYDNKEAGLPVNWREPIDQAQIHDLLYDSDVPTISAYDENSSILMPLPPPAYDYLTSPDMSDQSHLHGSHQQPDLEHAMHQQPSFEHAMHQQPDLDHPMHQQPSFEHAMHQQPSFEHTMHQQPSFEHTMHQQPSFEHTMHQQPSFEHTMHQQPSYEHDMHQQPRFEHIMHHKTEQYI